MLTFLSLKISNWYFAINGNKKKFAYRYNTYFSECIVKCINHIFACQKFEFVS